MSKTVIRILFAAILACVLIIGVVANTLPASVRADSEPTPGPNRKTTIQVDAMEYYWWLVYWSDNTIVCSITIDHEGKPTQSDVLNDCGTAIFDKWLHTPACIGSETGADLQACKGMYLHNTGSQPVSKEMEIDLAPAVVWVEITGCDYDAESGICTGAPSLLFTGEESLPNESITAIHVVLNSENTICPGSECTVALPTTSDRGVPFSFWGDSSYGDSSIVYEGLVRAVPLPAPTSTDPEEYIPTSYYIDVLSPQWKTATSASCAEVWQVFPEIGDPPAWLDTPSNAEGLRSSIPYYYLAAMLIKNGVVDASSCPNGGLDSNLSANQCGIEIAQPAVTEWQNRFDDQILQTSLDSGIPGQLLKNVFARESQLWPGIYKNVREAGFGQLTEDGADVTLLWNRSFYDQFCPLVLEEKTCALGYAMLNEGQQAMLKGALVQKVNATCADCPAGIDMTQANFSITVFAEALVGNCNQVNRLLYNVTHQDTADSASYSDLWRFTLVNYTAGPGCLFEAVSRTYKARSPLNWVNVAANLPESCRQSVDYVVKISQGDSEESIAFSTPLPTATRTPIKPTATVTLTRTPTPTRTVTTTRTPSMTMTPSHTPSVTPSPSPTESPTPTETPTPTVTPLP